MPRFYRDFPHFFQKCTVILPIFYCDFLTALIIKDNDGDDKHI